MVRNNSIDIGTLVLIRHGESQYNLENRFTGWIDVPLSGKGILEAEESGDKLKKTDIRIDKAYVSGLQRAQQSLKYIMKVIGEENMPVEQNVALNERHYGDLQGLNKQETAKKFGAERVQIWRRSYEVAPPNGESLKDTAARVLPYFDSKIMRDIKEGKNVLVVAHGNSLRCIVMRLDGLTKDQVVELNIATGIPIVYRFDKKLKVVSKKFL